jgi:hypothetical protein
MKTYGGVDMDPCFLELGNREEWSASPGRNPGLWQVRTRWVLAEKCPVNSCGSLCSWVFKLRSCVLNDCVRKQKYRNSCNILARVSD